MSTAVSTAAAVNAVPADSPSRVVIKPHVTIRGTGGSATVTVEADDFLARTAPRPGTSRRRPPRPAARASWSTPVPAS
ncbi:hypothetical protein ACYF6T_10035 [Streptomyces sp. 7R007]